jgi:ubiquinone/menaquinone biosynthesis C-methylase UbiE
MHTDNYRKHTTKNPLQRFLINTFFDELINEIQKLNPDAILDAGCGEGFTLERLHHKGIGNILEGVDFQEVVMLGKEIHPHLKLKIGNIYELPFADNTFDCVICTEVLEHLKSPVQALKELYRVTKKYCVITVPNEPFFRTANFLRGKNISRWGNDIDHIQHWSKRGIVKLLENHFKIKNVRTPFPWTIVVVER